MPAASLARGGLGARDARSSARAVVVYGRVGTYTIRTASLKKGMSADPELWQNCAESIRKHVVEPWGAVGRVDIFVQSWNVELAEIMDTFWSPRASDHAAQNYSLGRCPVRLGYCDRTMWALLGMKRALALRSQWAAGAGRGVVHATVLVMRHDVIWSSALPPLRADRAVRLWLPFDCRTAACPDRGARAADLYAAAPGVAQPPLRESCTEKKGHEPSAWSLVHAPRSVLSVPCTGPRAGAKGGTFCMNSVNIDWWWAGDVALADGFAETFDRFEHYSRLIRELLSFHNSAPHHYWGLYFFHTHRLRDKCQLGHAGVSGIDFTLGRFVEKGQGMRSCYYHGWRAYWRPPPWHGGSGAGKGGGKGGSEATGAAASPSASAPVSAGGSCNATAIPGYLTMCPGAPAHPVRKICVAADGADRNGSNPIEEASERGGAAAVHRERVPHERGGAGRGCC